MIMKSVCKKCWKYIIGAILGKLPLFVFTIIWLRPACFNPNWLPTYYQNLRCLFWGPYQFRSLYERYCVDVNFCFCVALAIVMILSFLESVKCDNKRIQHLCHRTAMILCVLWYAVLIITFILRSFILYNFNLQITVETLNFLFETNGDESMSFLKTYLFNFSGIKWMLKIFFMAFIVFLVEYLWKHWRNKLMHSRIAQVLTTLFFLSILPTMFKSLSVLKTYMWGSDYNTIMAVKSAWDEAEINKKKSEHFYVMVNEVNKKGDAATCHEDSVDVIFVIGESFIRKHAQIYGYFLQTTPTLQREMEKGNLFTFSDVMTPYNITTPSVQNMLSLNNLNSENKEEWYDYVFWPQLFHKAGYKTIVLDNQRGDDRTFGGGSFFQMYSSKIQSMCYSNVIEDVWDYDIEMVPSVEKCMNNNKDKSFYLLHFLGQHVFYGDRFPEEERKFSVKDYHRKESWMTQDKVNLISLYDNAVLHTDKTLGMLFRLFRNRKAVLVFVSDHGDEVYDYRDSSSRPPMDGKMKTEYALYLHTVPCFVWMSDAYKSAYPDIVKAIVERRNRPYCHDLIGNMVLTLGQISSPYYRSTDDILSNDYIVSRRMIYNQTPAIDYDSLMQCHSK